MANTVALSAVAEHPVAGSREVAEEGYFKWGCIKECVGERSISRQKGVFKRAAVLRIAIGE